MLAGSHVSATLSPYEYLEIVEMRLNFGLSQSELNDAAFDFSDIPNSIDIPVAELAKLLPDATVTIEQGSVGKGASGWGVAVVFSDLNNVVQDISGWIAVGGALWKIVRKIQKRHPDRQLVTRDADTAAALTIAALRLRKPKKYRWIKTICMTSGSASIGYDARDIWVTSLERTDNSILLIMSSPGGTILDRLTVMPEPFR